MPQYATYKRLPAGIEVTPHKDTETVTVSGKKITHTFVREQVIVFKGLEDLSYRVDEVHPNGLTMTNAATSIPRFYSWGKLFSGNSIWLDCFMVTGWMEVH